MPIATNKDKKTKQRTNKKKIDKPDLSEGSEEN